jgi:hypothetical protein
MLLIMSRNYSSFTVHCAINVPEGRSSCRTITLGITWGGKFSITLRTVLIWHPPITTSLVLCRIRREAYITRRTRHSRQLCVSAFGQLERSSAAREYSNFQNGGEICTEKRGLCRKISKCLWIKMVYLVFT